MTITIELTKEDARELEQLIEDYKMGVWADESYPKHFAYLLIKYLVGRE